MKKLKRTYTRCALTASLVLLVLLVAGSIWDLPISKFLYPGHESSLGQFFAAFGELPAFSLLAGCGCFNGTYYGSSGVLGFFAGLGSPEAKAQILLKKDLLK